MPIHDWTRVEAGVFHHFHHCWISAISDALNSGILPGDYYALAEQHAAGFGPDALTLEHAGNDEPSDTQGTRAAEVGVAVAAPKMQPTAEADLEFYRRKQNTVAVRHVSGDWIVAMIEIVSPGNKASRHGLGSFVEKAAELLDRRIHLLIMDLLPPGRRDPQGIHAAIWEEITGEEYLAPIGKPLTVVAYESALTVRAYVVAASVGDALPDTPLFLEPGGQVTVPLEATCAAAWNALPHRWQSVLSAPVV